MGGGGEGVLYSYIRVHIQYQQSISKEIHFAEDEYMNIIPHPIIDLSTPVLLSDLVWFMYADRNLYVRYRSLSTLAATQHILLKAYVPLIPDYQSLCAFIGTILHIVNLLNIFHSCYFLDH